MAITMSGLPLRKLFCPLNLSGNTTTNVCLPEIASAVYKFIFLTGIFLAAMQLYPLNLQFFCELMISSVALTRLSQTCFVLPSSDKSADTQTSTITTDRINSTESWVMLPRTFPPENCCLR